MGFGFLVYSSFLTVATAALIPAIHSDAFSLSVSDFKTVDLSYFEERIKPVDRNAVPLETPIALVIKNWGRFGNAVIQLLRAIKVCRLVNCRVIQTNQEQKWFLDENISHDWFKIEGSVKDLDKYTVLRDLFWDDMPDYEDNTYGDVSLVSSQVQKRLPESKLRKPDVDPNAIYAQIRSGDVFVGDHIPAAYGQPPMCYVELAASKRNYTQRVVVAEDTYNPVIGELMKKGWKLESSPLKDDLYTLTHAQHLVLTRGTFGHIMALLNVNESPEIFSFMGEHRTMSGNGIMHKYIPDEEYYDRVLRCWTASEEQKRLLVESKCHDFEPARQI